MKTYTTKIAKNGATLYYSTETGKRIAKETALENERNYILTNGTVKERYELAKENFRFNERGEVERLWFHDVVSYGNRYNFKVTTKYEWYVVSDKDADYALQKYCRMTLAEFRVEVEVETEENVEVEETTTEQVAEVSTVETEAQEVSKNFDADIRYEFNGGAGMDTSPNFTTATEAAQWIIDFAANHPEYTFTGGRVHDNGNCKRYPFTDADITTLNANKAAQEVSTEKVDIKEIIAEGLKQVDFNNVTKFEVGKTYYGAIWEGEFNPNVAVIVKKLTVTKITPQTICTVDENGLARRSKFTEAYAGTTEGFTIGNPNGYVDIYAFNEYTPAVAAVPTDNYTVWSEAVLAIKEGKTSEVNTMNTAAALDSRHDAEEAEPEVKAETYEELVETQAQEVVETKLQSPDEKLAELFSAGKTAWEAQRDKSFNSTQAETFRAATKAITKFLDTTRGAFKTALPENIIVADNWREGEFSGSSDLPSFVIRDLKTDKTLGTYKTLAEVEAAVVEQVAQVESAQEYKPQTVEDLRPELDALKIEADNVNEKYMRVRFALYICNHFYLNEVRKVLFPIRDEYYTEAAIMIDDAEKLYGKLKAINFDEITRNLDTFEYIRKGISNETYAATEKIFEEIRDKLGDKILASELSKLADEFGIDRALLLKSDACDFNPALFAEKTAESAPEPTETNSLKNLYAEVNSKYYAAISLPPALQKHVDTDALYSLRETLEEAMDSAKPAPPETPATVAPVETKLPPAESFTAKRDRLIAERAAANAKLKEAEETFKAAKLAKYNADDKLYTFMVSAVEELNEKLLPLPDTEIEVKTMEGYLAFIYPETVYADFTDMKFTLRGDCSELNGLTLGTYDTPEQVMTAVEQFKAAIERGDERFDFANPGQNFDKRAMRASLERAMKIALERHAEFCHAGKLSNAEDEMKLYAICRNALATLK